MYLIAADTILGVHKFELSLPSDLRITNSKIAQPVNFIFIAQVGEWSIFLFTNID